MTTAATKISNPMPALAATLTSQRPIAFTCGCTACKAAEKLVSTLIQADRFGTSIAQTLRTHSEFMRLTARQRAEEKAAKMGIKLVFPIFFCILPSLFVVTVGPVIVTIFTKLIPMMTEG